MATMPDQNDREMPLRMADLFKENAELSKDYFARPSPEDAVGRQRHADAVRRVNEALVREEQAARSQAAAPAAAQQDPAGQQQRQAELKAAMREPAYLDRNHRDHASAVSRVTGLYQQLNT